MAEATRQARGVRTSSGALGEVELGALEHVALECEHILQRQRLVWLYAERVGFILQAQRGSAARSSVALTWSGLSPSDGAMRW